MHSPCARTLHKGIRSALGALALALALGQTAEARVETLRWSHSSVANVDGFRLHTGSSPGAYTTTIDVGKPSSSNGIFSFNLNVADNATVYVAVTAYGAGFLESFYSNAKALAPVSTAPPPSPTPSPTPSEAVWSQDFEFSATGTSIPGWRDTGADSSFSENDSLFGVVSVSGDRLLSTSSSLSNIHSHLVSSGADQWSNYEVRGRMRNSDLRGGVGVTIYSQFPQADSYYRLRTFGGNAFEMAPHPHGASVSCAPATTGVVPVANTWYRFRLRVTPLAGANSIQAKVWPDGTSEPTPWQTTCTDTRSNRPTKGAMGVYHSGPGTSQWDDFAVLLLGGSAGPQAPLPPPPPPVLFPVN